MDNQPIPACEYARDRHRILMRWRNLWSSLLFIFGATIVIFLSIAVILFINESWLPGGISLVGTIAQGAAISWAVTRRGEAVKEEEAAYEDAKKVCFPNGGPGLDQFDDDRRRGLGL